MNQQAVAIIIAGALIAGAIALTNHWSFLTGGYPTGTLLNRWTGTVYLCGPPQQSFEISCPLQRGP